MFEKLVFTIICECW